MKALNAIRFYTATDYNYITGYTYEIILFRTRFAYAVKLIL